MAGTPDTLDKIIAIEHIMLADPWGLTVAEIIDRLNNQYGIRAERKGIYTALNVLTRFWPIKTYKAGRQTYYCVGKKWEVVDK